MITDAYCDTTKQTAPAGVFELASKPPLQGSVAVRLSAMMRGTTRTTESSMKTLNPAVAQVLKRLHYPLEVILTCVRWYVAYPLSLRHLEE
jgi:hypothetical protein